MTAGGPADQPGDSLSIQVQQVGAKPLPGGAYELAIVTSRGPIPGILHPREGGEAAVIWISGAIGGLDGPAGKAYALLGQDLVAQGLTSLRLNYRMPGELEECVLDTLAGVSVLKGLGASRVAVVGHSFGGAVAITAGTLSEDVVAVAALSSQTAGATGAGRLAPRPLLLIHGEDDAHLTYQCSQMIYDWAGEPKELRILPGGGHGLRECADQVREILRAWLIEKLRP
jgi:fermentation-respiration switch protein FrsA (DUF1100 family)